MATDNNSDQIAINFLPLSKQDFEMEIFVNKVIESGQPTAFQNVKTYKLPSELKDTKSEYANYYVSSTAQAEFTSITVKSKTNNALTIHRLFNAAVDKCKNVFVNGNDFTVETGFSNRIHFNIGKHTEGTENIWIEAYHLSSSNEFGFLIGFHFTLAADQPFNKAVQQRSLSIGLDGKENINYYADYLKKLQFFISHYIPRIFPLKFHEEINISNNFRELGFERLQGKKYIFNNEKVEASQFMGIKKHGPLVQIADNSLICFLYRPEDKPLSYELYHALKGEKYSTFSGMADMFSFSLGKEHVTGLSLIDYSEQSINSAISHIKETAGGKPVLPLLLVPWSRLDHTEEGGDDYFRIKHQFLLAGLPTQFVSLQRMRARDGLKWSISNIGLAVFCKLGGMPWKLQPRHEKCLIIGIGQAHRKKENGEIAKYFAYSVLSDSSGLYDSIQVLSKSDAKDQYLDGLTENIKRVILDKSSKYDRFVIHTPFKVKIDEMSAIKKGLDEVFTNVNKEIVALKFNDKSKYFGFSLTNNSKVPFESSCVSLGKRQYLVWFEGLQYHNPTIRRRISKPMHIEFIYSSGESDLTSTEEITYLQDAINLSGANWRGFNAKSSPVSVYYAKIIADYIGQFDRLGLAEIDIENLPPWFL
jgi:hypothetical protein